MNGLDKLYLGDFNEMHQDWQPDGSVIITLTKRGEGKSYRFHVKDLYSENEEVLSHEVIPHQVPEWVTQRIEEAKKHGKPD